ncbi:MAG: DNA mismatch repair endonuclease MutL [Clostridia bacterium]|nr:DNA mismatch repair endonuclease MutL [Clostridia bacterium]
MGIINVLTPDIFDKLAAGEVVENPAAAIKELAENSIDAGADVISVEFLKNGTPFIRITDNGKGMSKDDATLCFLRHATSKIRTSTDLFGIQTLGFRGEAMSSIGAVAKVELYTKRKEDEIGTKVVFEAGKLISEEENGCADGTTIVVKDLFFNTPARMKFLKKDATEAGYISDTLTKFILSHPEISFKLTRDGEDVVHTPGDNDLVNAIYSVYGRNAAENTIKVDYEMDGVHVWGVIGSKESARSDRRRQTFYVNGRYIQSRAVSKALEEAYKTEIMIGKFPVSVINIDISHENVDVNVHPRKLEVKFSDESLIYRAVYHAVKNALSSEKHVPEMTGFDFKEESDTMMPKEAFGWDISPVPQNRGGHSQYEKRQISFNPAPRQDSYKTDMPEPLRSPERGEDVSEKFPSTMYFDYEFNDMPYKYEPKIRVIGQLFDTYILAEEEDMIVFIDQHAAHERLKYEELIRDLESRVITPQYLVAPFPVEITDTEVAAAEEHKEELSKLGYELTRLKKEWFLTAVPSADDEERVVEAFLEIVTALIENKHDVIGKVKQRLLYTIACKAAIKANKKLSMDEMNTLVKDIYALKNINTCPHGRPIMIKMTKKQIEKDFGRLL